MEKSFKNVIFRVLLVKVIQKIAKNVISMMDIIKMKKILLLV